MSPQPTPPERAERAAAELRDLIRQAHEAAQALNDAVKTARAAVGDYLHDGVQSTLDSYTGMLQGQIDLKIKQLNTTAADYQTKMHRRLQAVADAHSLLYITLAQSICVAIDPPDSTMAERRQLIIDSGNAMVEVYRRAGLRMPEETLDPQLLARVDATTRPMSPGTAQLLERLESEYRAE
jgi:hypothetical protein